MTRPLLLAAAAALLAGCASPGPVPKPAPLITPAAAGLVDAAGVFPDARWWTALGDPALDALVDAALAGQPSLQAAAARVAAADAALAAVQAGQGPQAALTADATRQRFSEHGLVPPAVAGDIRNTANLAVGGRWALDFFGRHAAAIGQAVGRQRALQAEAQAARQLLAGQVTQGWIGLARLVAQRGLALEVVAQRRAVRDLVAERQGAGLETQAARSLAEGGVAEAEMQVAALDGQIAAARHRLAVLAGQPPQALAGTLAPEGNAPQVPAGVDGLPLARPMAQWVGGAAPQLAGLRLDLPPPHLGADLLGRRADVVAARWRVEAAARGLDAARADFYPDINLNASFGLNALGLDKLLNLGSRQFALGPALRLPLFDGGLLRAQLQGRAAEADAAVAAYNATVLDAAREVADAAAALRSLARQQTEQVQLQAAAADARELARQRFSAGLGNRLPVLQADAALLAQRALAADLQARRLDAQAALALALGGGWADAPPAAPPAAAATAAAVPTPTARR